jgi:hypothetical protein
MRGKGSPATAVAGVVSWSQAVNASATTLHYELDVASSDDESRLIIDLGPSSMDASSLGREDHAQRDLALAEALHKQASEMPVTPPSQDRPEKEGASPKNAAKGAQAPQEKSDGTSGNLLHLSAGLVPTRKWLLRPERVPALLREKA